ncbi:MAG TPA: aminotransferase class I/II-fold pyridoxal phosphate-dependent enzyme, partial [Candidatus Woesearchaeota archaeon]|nr:aminotransferase class I/II-fold pyridoxal phosphate-dependent enzyme [Candidatus Woesearchaeota archaeon]
MNPLRISEREKNLGTETAFEVLAEVNKLRSEGKEIINFCIGQPDFDTPKKIKEAIKTAIDEGKTGYTNAAGLPELREAAANWLSKTREITVEPDSIVVSSGAKPFIEYTILSVTDYGKGHEVIFPVPGYPIYQSQIELQGCKAVPLYLRENKKYSFEIEELREKITDNTRLLILNSPHNPTGGVLNRKTLEQIAEIVLEKENLWVYSDEVYSQFTYDDKFQSIASIDGMQERTIIADGMSKTWAMTGSRMGFMSNKALAKAMTDLVINTVSCASHFVQYGGIEALTQEQKETKEMYKAFKSRRDLIVNKLNEIEGISCVNPGGAFYVWPNVTE